MEQSEIRINVVETSTKIVDDVLEYFDMPSDSFLIAEEYERISLELYDVIYNKLKELEIKE